MRQCVNMLEYYATDDQSINFQIALELQRGYQGLNRMSMVIQWVARCCSWQGTGRDWGTAFLVAQAPAPCQIVAYHGGGKRI